MNPSDLIHPNLLKYTIDTLRWKDLTDIQKEAIPVILDGHDSVIEAPTSGGKTEAVLFPTLTRASNNKASGVRILYIAPLKALLNDIELRANEYAPKCGLRSFKWHGDVSQTDKINQILDPPELLLITPESLEAILLRKSDWVKFFSNLQSVIIDETHNFAIGDRGAHLLSLLERIEYDIKLQPQRIALTATIGNPDELLCWLAGTKRKPGVKIAVTDKRNKEKDFMINHFDVDLDNIEEGINMYEKLSNHLYSLLAMKKTIVFGNSRSNTEEIASFINEQNKLTNTKHPVNVRTHHSSVSKYFREQAETMIKMKSDSLLNSIISTSTLELGIDIGELDQVIQLGGLSSSSSFLQRVGRTGRREGKKQFFRALTSGKEELLILSACITLGLKKISENIIFCKKSYHILAHQVICLSLQKNGTSIDEAWEILSGAYCYKNISKEKFIELIEFMIDNNILRDTDGIVIGEVVEKEFLFANWMRLFAVFDSGPMYNVVDGKNHVGMLDCSFVRSQEIPFLFVLCGIEWEATKVNHDSQQVSVKKTQIGTAPKWEAMGTFDIPYETAKEVGRILMGKDNIDYLDKDAHEGIDYMRNQLNNLNWKEGSWLIRNPNPNEVIIWTFGGDKLNRTLSTYFRSKEIGVSTYNYKNVTIKRTRTEQSAEENNFSEIVLSEISELKEKKYEDIVSEMLTIVNTTRFSKFSRFLPDDLVKESIIDSSMDVGRLREIISKIEISCRIETNNS